MTPLSAPTVVNLEITGACNLRCGHCYNPERSEGKVVESLSQDQFENLVDQFRDCGVFHVILSGGEPLVRSLFLASAVTTLVDAGISVSLNSNLTLMTTFMAEGLVEAGLDHVLCSWYSSSPRVTDSIAGRPGTHQRLVRGICTAIKGGLRVSANLIVTKRNWQDVYDSGHVLSALGVTKYFAHRAVPTEITREEALRTLDDLLRVRDETSMEVGTLISYPLCLLPDLERYAPFVGRGCPSQRGLRFNIASNGDASICVMEHEGWGNVFTGGLRKCWERAEEWHNGSYRYVGCEGCSLIEVCQTGCRMSARWVGPDPLMTAPVKAPLRVELPTIAPEARCRVLPGMRWRWEGGSSGFWLCNLRWGDTIRLPAHVGTFLRDREEFRAHLFPSDWLAPLVRKGVVLVDGYDPPKHGVSLDPSMVVL